MNPEIEKLMNELKSYGLDDKKLEALMSLAYEDFMAELKLDLENLSDDDMTQLENTFTGMKLEDLMTTKDSKVNEILQKVYGMSAKSKVDTFVIEYLQDAVNQAKEAKDMLIKLQNNDPQLLEEIKNMDNNPNKADIDAAIKAASEI